MGGETASSGGEERFGLWWTAGEAVWAGGLCLVGPVA